MKGKIRPFEYMHWAQTEPIGVPFNLTASGMDDAVLRPSEDDTASEFWSERVEVADLCNRAVRPQRTAEFLAAVGKRYGVAPGCVTPTLGASQGIMHVLLGLVRAGDHVIVERPTYEALHRVPTLLGADVSRLERKFEENWEVVPERLAKLLTPKTRAVILSSLHNPTGAGLTRETLEAVGEMAARVGALVLVDEVYLDFVFDPEGETYAPACMVVDNAVSWSSTTKVFGFSALRAGWIVTRNPEVASAMREAARYLCVDVPTATTAFGAKVLASSDRLTARARQTSERGLAVVQGWLESESRVRWVPPVSGVCGQILLPDLLQDGPFVAHLRERYETLVVPGSHFEAPGSVRLGFGGDPKILERGLENFSKALDDLAR